MREREREKKEREDERGEERGAKSLSEATQDGGGVVDHSGEMEEWEAGRRSFFGLLFRAFKDGFRCSVRCRRRSVVLHSHCWIKRVSVI